MSEEKEHKFRIILHSMPEGQVCEPCETSKKIIQEAIGDYDIDFKVIKPENGDEAIAPYAPVIIVQSNCGSKTVEGGVTSRADLDAILTEVSCDAVRAELWGAAKKKVEQLESAKKK